MLVVNCKFRTEEDKILLFNGNNICFSNMIGLKILNIIHANKNLSKSDCIKIFLNEFNFNTSEDYNSAKEDVERFLNHLISMKMILGESI
ncbi:hypothetical protein [Clostridium sp. SGI.024]|uniref:hypothetical protein n=1 Tax=Clostridium sp. SGI.024 TaxID=3420551 RepID=UPI003D083C21